MCCNLSPSSSRLDVIKHLACSCDAPLAMLIVSWMQASTKHFDVIEAELLESVPEGVVLRSGRVIREMCHLSHINNMH